MGPRSSRIVESAAAARAILRACAVVIALGAAFASSASAQGARARGSLGGYGGSAAAMSPGMGTSGAMIPYAGRFGGFMPSRMSGSGNLGFSPRSSTAMGTVRPSFSLSTMSDGMGMGSGGSSGMGGAKMSGTFGASRGMATGRGMGRGMSGSASGSGMGVMPPSFAYPFRQPPSLMTPESGGGGMGMSM